MILSLCYDLGEIISSDRGIGTASFQCCNNYHCRNWHASHHPKIKTESTQLLNPWWIVISLSALKQRPPAVGELLVQHQVSPGPSSCQCWLRKADVGKKYGPRRKRSHSTGAGKEKIRWHKNLGKCLQNWGPTDAVDVEDRSETVPELTPLHPSQKQSTWWLNYH